VQNVGEDLDEAVKKMWDVLDLDEVSMELPEIIAE